jgi:oligopeptidase B
MYHADGTNPLYLYGYGSYGISIPLVFRKSIFSLLDRGFVYAIAHIRGGDDLGYGWYESAKFLNKKTTFHDFIDSAKYLVNQGYTTKGKITIAGGSAGGMLIGVCMNEESELFQNAVAHVPFVDVLNTMLDANLPLTPGEFKEWGNPKDIKFYNYIKGYSPYDNIKKQRYPNLFVTAGLNDPRVTYWEPAKWVAKLREYKTDDNTMLLLTNMDTGHAGKSGRYSYLWDVAKEYAFVISN